MQAPPADEPRSLDELLRRARSLAGRSLGELARACAMPLPAAPARAKGFAGQLVERALGANSRSRAEADFAALGVELKTIPVDAQGQPRESTFVTSIDPGEPGETRWASSRVLQKLAQVLWVPVESERTLEFSQRRVGWPVLWRPSAQELAALREDFEALLELCESDLGERIGARAGRILQLRPKGANARALRWSRDAEGEAVRTAPRAFYLRARFTRQILAGAWIVPGR